MNAANQRQLTPWLVATTLLLGALFVLLLAGFGRTAQWDEPRTVAALPAASRADGLPQPIPLQQFAEVWHKPLFNPERKPVAHSAEGDSQLGDLQLTGIILTPALRMALLHDRNNDREIRLREGESLPDGSVTLVEVHPRSALFDAATGRTELKLPAGAPIDTVRGAADAAPDAARDAEPRAAADSGLTPQPLPLPKPAVSPDSRATPRGAGESPAARLRQNIQKRRAERAASANEGVR